VVELSTNANPSASPEYHGAVAIALSKPGLTTSSGPTNIAPGAEPRHVCADATEKRYAKRKTNKTGVQVLMIGGSKGVWIREKRCL
jgi:hypothetical protein